MIRRTYLVCAYYFSWFVFGAGGLALNAYCAALLLLPGRSRRAPAVREAIRRLFSAWVWWLRTVGLARVHWHFPNGALVRPAVYVANHPSLLDATLVLPRLQDAICIFKPSMLRNPFLAPAALMAGYAVRDAGLDLIRGVASQIREGRTLLIFPEGTRTDAGAAVNALKPGFALIARRAGVPVQILVIQTARDLCPRGRPWWLPPSLPARIDIHVDRIIPTDTELSVTEIVQKVQQRFATQLAALP